MSTFSAKIEKSGRVLIPAEIRRELGLTPGQEIVLRAEDGEVHLATRLAVVRRIQWGFRRWANGRSLSEELIAERRAEAARE